MTVSDDMQRALDAPLDPSRVAHRDSGNGRQVSYIEAFDAINTANRIFGYDGWAYEVLAIQMVNTFEATNGLRTLYEARVRVEALGVTRADVGTTLTANDAPDSHDMAIKGAVSDGLKRALRTFGPQFGNDLYDKSAPVNGQQSRPAAPPARTHETPQERAPIGRVPNCSTHQRPMKEWGGRDEPKHWKCTAKVGNGYCTETAPMSPTVPVGAK